MSDKVLTIHIKPTFLLLEYIKTSVFENEIQSGDFEYHGLFLAISALNHFSFRCCDSSSTFRVISPVWVFCCPWPSGYNSSRFTRVRSSLSFRIGLNLLMYPQRQKCVAVLVNALDLAVDISEHDCFLLDLALAEKYLAFVQGGEVDSRFVLAFGSVATELDFADVGSVGKNRFRFSRCFPCYTAATSR